MKKYCGILIVILSIAAIGWPSDSDNPGSIETTRTVIEKWVDTQGLISKEKQDWALTQQSLNDRIDMVKNEIDSLQGNIAKAQKDVNDKDANLSELIKENDNFKSASEELGKIVTKLESKTLSLNNQLPEPIRERIKPLSQRIPEDPNKTELSLSQRFQNVIGILNELNKFNHEITVTSEVRKLSDGSSVEVTALYIGLGQAYYVNASGTIAGVGRPSENGWNWESANEAADKIMDVVSILKNEKVASFIPLPVKVK